MEEGLNVQWGRQDRICISYCPWVSNFNDEEICRGNWSLSHGAEMHPVQEWAKLKKLARTGGDRLLSQRRSDNTEGHQHLMPCTDLWVQWEHDSGFISAFPLSHRCLLWPSWPRTMRGRAVGWRGGAGEVILETVAATLSWYNTNPPQSCKREKNRRTAKWSTKSIYLS